MRTLRRIFKPWDYRNHKLASFQWTVPKTIRTRMILTIHLK